MLTSITLVDSVEMIRDGGSLAVVFHGKDSCEYWLFLKILMRTLESGDVERLGYAAPTIVDRLTNLEEAITWEQALSMLGQAGQMIHQECDLKWHAIMRKVVISKGLLPDELDKLMHVVRN
jgi:hypothetical protein